jgi:hypothetical protein
MSRRIPVTGPALVRVLARLADIDSSSESRQSFADRLSQWLRWNDAISLAGALNTAPVAARALRGGDAAADYRKVRAALEAAIAADSHARPNGLQPLPGAEPEADFSTFRHRYQTRQQAMEAGIAPLRARLRARLATRSAEHARLAAVDAVMEQVMGTRERSLLLHVPALLERRFRRLQADAAATQAPGDTAGAASAAVATNLWLQQFRREMHELLLAELDLRLQPVEGLLAALDPAAASPVIATP